MNIKSFQALTLLTLLCACTPGPTKEVPDEFKNGQKQFHRVCSNCHGSDAMGGHTKAPRLIDEEFLPPDFTDDDIADTILNGSSSEKMPSQKDNVSAEEIEDIIKYLRYSQRAAGVELEDEEEEEDEW